METPKCTCRGSVCQDKHGNPATRWYRCARCQRRVPWCFGAADDMPELCDDCWAAARPAVSAAETTHVA